MNAGDTPSSLSDLGGVFEVLDLPVTCSDLGRRSLATKLLSTPQAPWLSLWLGWGICGVLWRGNETPPPLVKGCGGEAPPPQVKGGLERFGPLGAVPVDPLVKASCLWHAQGLGSGSRFIWWRVDEPPLLTPS